MNGDQTRIRFAEAVGEALRLEFGRDPRAVYIGSPERDPLAAELRHHGHERVIHADRTERTLIAQAIGAALEGYHPVCRLDAAELPSRGLDQLVEAQALHAVEGLAAPLTVLVDRAAGDSSRGIDPDAPERWLHPAGVPTVSPAEPSEAKGLVAAALRSPGPLCVIVDERLTSGSSAVPEGGHLIEIGSAQLVRSGAALTIVAHGAAVRPALRLADDGELDVDILDLRSIVPVDHLAIAASVRRTNRIVVFEPTLAPTPVGDAVIAEVVSTAFEYLDAPPLQIAMGTRSDEPLGEALSELVGY